MTIYKPESVTGHRSADALPLDFPASSMLRSNFASFKPSSQRYFLIVAQLTKIPPLKELSLTIMTTSMQMTVIKVGKNYHRNRGIHAGVDECLYMQSRGSQRKL